MKINDMRISAIGGTICSIWARFSLGDVLQTVLTAALGYPGQFSDKPHDR